MLPVPLTAHTVSIIMKEAVRRSVNVIRRERLVFTAQEKIGYGGELNDMLTSADTAAQEVYQDVLEECFPGIGLIGEEVNLSFPCTIEGCDAYFTIDPLDGTKAFVREQSHGVSSMLALVVNGEVVSAWIGDVNTEELYGYRPESDKVHRIDQYEHGRYLHTLNREKDIGKSYFILRESLSDEDPIEVRTLAKSAKEYLVDGGSIGTWMARLWKGEVDGAIISPSHETPWDSTPIIGISLKLGFVFLRNTNSGWERFNPPLVKSVERRPYWMAVVHESNLSQVPNLV